jgi:hypothetical protein
VAAICTSLIAYTTGGTLIAIAVLVVSSQAQSSARIEQARAVQVSTFISYLPSVSSRDAIMIGRSGTAIDGRFRADRAEYSRAPGTGRSAPRVTR